MTIVYVNMCFSIMSHFYVTDIVYIWRYNQPSPPEALEARCLEETRRREGAVAKSAGPHHVPTMAILNSHGWSTRTFFRRVCS